MRQVWHDLLFAHWPLDTFDCQAWIGVVPFHMSGVRLRYLPPLPRLSAFPEMNVRTYVTRDNKPGVYFFSLDAANPLAVWAARRFYHLPYFNARMSVEHRDGWVQYESTRTHRGTEPASLSARYRPTGDLLDLEPETIDRWLTDRYCLYTTDRQGRVIRQEIDHPRWPLQPAEAVLEHNSMTPPVGVTLPATKPLLHFSRRLEVRIWSADRL
jgi:uncharacterized protein